jgi:hypothetical protein
MRRVWLLAVLTVPTACGGSTFSAAPEGDATADTQQEPSDAPGSDGTAVEAAGRSDAGVEEAASPDTGSSDFDAGTEDVDGGLQDATPDVLESGEPDAALEGSAGDGSADVQDAQSAADVEACAPILYFLDGDGDGYGGTSTSRACVPPTTGTWVTVGGDCDDSNATVNPGQTSYFAAGYVPPGTTSVSFDYNCDGAETESGSPVKAACAIVNLSCGGSGYLEMSPVRSGPGVDPFCGSTQAVTCAWANLVCQAGLPYAVAPIACH